MGGARAARPRRTFGARESFSRRDIAVLCLLVAAWLMVLAALAGTWFVRVSTTNAGGAATDDRGFGIFGWSATDTTSGASVGVTGTYALLPTVGAVFLVLGLATVTAVFLGAVSLVLAYLACVRRRAGRYVVLGYATGIWTLVIPVAFAIAFPSAAIADGFLPGGGFVGAASLSGGTPATWTWGPGWAWYGLLVAGSLFLVLTYALSRLHARPPAASRDPLISS